MLASSKRKHITKRRDYIYTINCTHNTLHEKLTPYKIIDPRPDDVERFRATGKCVKVKSLSTSANNSGTEGVEWSTYI